MKRVLVSSAVLALAVAGVHGASAAPAVYKVTGGGQTLVPAEGGAGDTIAFAAQSQGAEGEDAKGQFQYQDRTGGTGKGQQTFHGTVTCVVVFATEEGMPAMAAIGGYSGTEAFRIDVTDDGSGNAGNDMILVRHGADAQDSDGSGDTALCDEGDRPDELPALDRGNVTIHKQG